MTANGFFQLGLYLALLFLLVKPLGAFMARVYQFRPLFGLDRLIGPIERLFYKACGVRISDEQDWKGYAMSCLAFNLLGVLVVFLLQRVQGWLPLNPAALGPVTPDSSFNTATSFATNTN